MTEKKRKTGLYWGIFVASSIVLLLLTIFRPEGFWLGLPSFFTSISLAMDWV